MLIYLLLAIFLLMFYGVYRIFDKDIVNPNFLLVAGYTLCVVSAAVNVNSWGIDLHWNTVGVLVYGTGIFLITGYFVKNYLKNKYNENNIKLSEIKPILYNKKYLFYFCIFQLAILLMWIANIFYITSSIGDFNSFSERMVAFRQWNSYGVQWINNILYNVLNQLNQVSTQSIYITSFILLTNIIENKSLLKAENIRENRWLYISIVVAVLQMLMTGGRLEVIAFVLYCLVLMAVFYKQNYGHPFILTPKRILVTFLSICFGAMAFYLSKAVVGRGVADISFSNFLPYITMYAGGPVQLLDMFLENPIPVSDIWGKETFYNLNFFLSRFGLVDFEPYIAHLEFRNAVTGVNLGNIYTAYRSYLYDFGFLGLTILPVIFSAIVNYVYYKKYYNGINKGIDILVLLYGIFTITIFCDFVRSFFYMNLFSSGILKKIFIFAVLSYLFTGKIFNLKMEILKK